MFLDCGWTAEHPDETQTNPGLSWCEAVVATTEQNTPKIVQTI